MRGLQLTLTESEFIVLTDYLISAHLTEYNQAKLQAELMDARIVTKDCLPLNIVCENSKVVVWNMDKNQTYSVQIVFPDSVNGKDNTISIYDPISIALLGYPTGAVTQWEMPDGINTLKVISVSQVDSGRVYV